MLLLLMLLVRQIGASRLAVHGLAGRLLLLLLLLVRMQVVKLLFGGHRCSAHQTDGADIELVVTETRCVRLKLNNNNNNN